MTGWPYAVSWGLVVVIAFAGATWDHNRRNRKGRR